MTKKEAVAHMIEEIKRIEREQLASRLSVDTTKQKREVVDAIMKALKEVQIDDEN